MWIGSKHRVRWLTAGDSVGETRGVSFRPSLTHHHSKERPPSPAAGHTLLNTHDYSHDIPKHGYMTSIQLPRRIYYAGHFTLKRARCITMPARAGAFPWCAHLTINVFEGQENEVCAQGSTICAGVCMGVLERNNHSTRWLHTPLHVHVGIVPSSHKINMAL